MQARLYRPCKPHPSGSTAPFTARGHRGGGLLHYVETLIDVGGHRSIFSPVTELLEFYFSLLRLLSVLPHVLLHRSLLRSLSNLEQFATAGRDAIERNVRDTDTRVASRLHEKFTALREPVSGFLDLIPRSRYTSVCIMQ